MTRLNLLERLLLAEATGEYPEPPGQPDELPLPCDGLGYSHGQVREIFGPDTGAFFEWMGGQTMGIGPEGGMRVYPHDLWRYWRGSRRVFD